MNSDDYRKTYTALGLTQNGAARFLEAPQPTGHRWGRLGCPRAAGKLLKLALVLLKVYGLTPARIDALIKKELGE